MASSSSRTSANNIRSSWKISAIKAGATGEMPPPINHYILMANGLPGAFGSNGTGKPNADYV